MEIQKLHIHNIASIEDAEIDFDGEILGGSQLILICGETGAGKSTILDSICLALYADAPRLRALSGKNMFKAEGSEMNVKKGEQISFGDTRNLVRRGCNEAWARLRFAGNNGNEYEAEWKVKRGKINKQFNKAEWEWRNLTKGTVLKKDNEIGEEAVSALGLTYQQFCRTTMLAQGEFDKFLVSEKKDKTDILEKLTDTAVFSEISAAIYNRWKQKDEKFKEENSGVEALLLQSLSDEQLSEKRAALQQIIQELKLTNSQSTEKQNLLKAAEAYHTCNSELNLLQKEKEQMEIITASSDFKDKKSKVELWDKTAEARVYHKNATEEKNAMQRLEEEENQLYEQYKALCCDMAGADEAMQKKRAERLSLTNAVEAEKHNAALYANIKVIEQNFLRLAKCAADKHKIASAFDSSLNAVPDDLSYGAYADCGIRERAAAMTTLASALDDAVRQFDRLALNNAKSKIDEQQNAVRNIIGFLEKYITANKEKQEYLTALEEQQRKVEDLEQQQKQGQTVLEGYKENIDAEKKVEEAVSLSLDETLCEARLKLKLGDECPLCGQRINSLKEQADFESVLLPIRQRIKDLQAKYDSAAQKLSETVIAIKTGQNSIQNLKTAIDKKQNYLNELTAGLLEYDMFNKQKFDSAQSALEYFADLENRLKTKTDNLNNLNSRIQKLQELGNIVGHTAISYKNSADNLDRALKDEADIYKQTEEYMGSGDWKDSFSQEGLNFVNRLKSSAEAYMKNAENLEKVSSQLDKAGEQIERIKSSKNEILAKKPVWADYLPVAKSNGGRLEERWKSLSESLSVSVSKYADSKQKFTQDTLAVDAKIKELSIDFEQFMTIYNQTPHNIELARNELETILKNNQEHTVKIGAKQADRDKAYIELKKMCDDEAGILQLSSDDGLSSLKAEVELLKKKNEELNNERGALENELNNQERLNNQIKDKKEALQQLKDDLDKWKSYSNLLGSFDGEKFKSIAQSYVFKELLGKANYYLSMLGKRYTLENQDMAVLIRDHFEGGLLRPSNTLSGGEKFMASLALALGLSSLNAKGISCNMLFIDEGFGSLSNDHLNTVIEALQALYQIKGQRVVIISHVECLREKISSQIQVHRVSKSKSELVLIGA